MSLIQRVNNFIDGQFVSNETYLESFNPSTEEVIAHIADGSAEDAEQAVQAARKAFPLYVK
jgi:acyl-CoA reductase-like NAD-dependent aldehyde dehydrogenase